MLLPYEFGIELVFDALQTDAVDPGETDQLRGQTAIGVVAAVLGDEFDTGSRQVAHGLSLPGGNLALDPYEMAVRGEPGVNVPPVHLERRRQGARHWRRVFDQAWIGGQGKALDAHRQFAHLGVVDGAAFADGVDGLRILAGGFLGQGGTADHLQVGGPKQNNHQSGQKKEAHQADPQAEIFRLAADAHSMTTICRGDGAASPSWRPRISIRLGDFMWANSTVSFLRIILWC